MPYFAPYIDSTGLHFPGYQDIVDQLVEEMKSIYGTDIYLEVDSQDYQFLSIQALKIYDCMLLLQSVYNSRSPVTAIGSALDAIVKINGIKRSSETFSTAPVQLTGTEGTVLTSGIVTDANGFEWNLPASVTIPVGGTIEVTAICSVGGVVTALPGTITEITTPTLGWDSVTNLSAATPGIPTETDPKLRSRQGQSVSLPSKTVLEGTIAAIAAIDGVTRQQVYENDTNAVNADGHPAHSITAVVEGGLDADIANAIYLKKTPGCYTNGTTSYNIVNELGQTTVIRFYRTSYVEPDITVNVKALAGYTSATTDDIKNRLVAFLDSLSIGDDIQNSSLWGAALSAITDFTKPTFSITTLTSAKHLQAQDSNPIPIAFNEVAKGNVTQIVVNVT